MVSGMTFGPTEWFPSMLGSHRRAVNHAKRVTLSGRVPWCVVRFAHSTLVDRDRNDAVSDRLSRSATPLPRTAPNAARTRPLSRR